MRRRARRADQLRLGPQKCCMTLGKHRHAHTCTDTHSTDTCIHNYSLAATSATLSTVSPSSLLNYIVVTLNVILQHMRRRETDREIKERESPVELKQELESELEREMDKSVGVRGGRTVLGQSVNNNIEIHVAHSGGGKESRTRATLTGLIRRRGRHLQGRRSRNLKSVRGIQRFMIFASFRFRLAPSPYSLCLLRDSAVFSRKYAGQIIHLAR